MAEVDAATFIALLGALGLGSILAQFVSGGIQRRELRSRVLAALDACENARWANLSSDPPATSFAERARELQAAALVARVPRAAVAQYLWLSFAGFWLSCESAEEDPYGEGGIPARFSDAIRASASVLVDVTWRPALTRIQLSKRLRRVGAKAEAEAAKSTDLVRLLDRSKARAGLAR